MENNEKIEEAMDIVGELYDEVDSTGDINIEGLTYNLEALSGILNGEIFCQHCKKQINGF